MNTIIKYINTLKYLKFGQFYNRVIFKFTNPKVNLQGIPSINENFKNKVPFPKVKNVLSEKNNFKFLNEEHTITNDWNDKNINKLWLYNLHYFDFLRQENITYEQSLFWIEKWIDENKIGYGNGWEPYTLSLRIVNWIKFYLAGNKLSEKIIKSLAIQTEYLSKKIEYHLLANHLLANAKALVFAGLFFTTESCKKQKIRGLEDWKNGNDNDRGIEVLRDRGLKTDDGNGKILQQAQDNRIRKLAEKWLNKGIEIYNKQLPEQILNDGGHFERSAMYHSIILEDLLDLKNISAPLELDKYISKMLDWLSVMTGPDGKISLFNDAAFGIALEPKEIFKYAEQLGFKVKKQENSCDLFDTGYARLQKDNWTIFCDGAPLGPDYQLGHSHADSLTFELWYKNERIICDSGTKQYFNSDIRKYQRGTSAHNTIVIDGKNSSQVWSAHRTAKRAKIVERKFDNNNFSATHNGYKPILHKRKWYFENGEVCIKDEIRQCTINGNGEIPHQVRDDNRTAKTPDCHARHKQGSLAMTGYGKKQNLVEVFFHIHPKYDVCIEGNKVKIFNNENVFNMKVDNNMDINIIDGTVSFEFGKEENNKIVCLKKKATLPFNIKTTIGIL